MLDKNLQENFDSRKIVLSHEVHFVTFYNDATILQETLAKLLSYERAKSVVGE